MQASGTLSDNDVFTRTIVDYIYSLETLTHDQKHLAAFYLFHEAFHRSMAVNDSDGIAVIQTRWAIHVHTTLERLCTESHNESATDLWKSFWYYNNRLTLITEYFRPIEEWLANAVTVRMGSEYFQESVSILTPLLEAWLASLGWRDGFLDLTDVFKLNIDLISGPGPDILDYLSYAVYCFDKVYDSHDRTQLTPVQFGRLIARQMHAYFLPNDDHTDCILKKTQRTFRYNRVLPWVNILLQEFEINLHVLGTLKANFELPKELTSYDLVQQSPTVVELQGPVPYASNLFYEGLRQMVVANYPIICPFASQLTACCGRKDQLTRLYSVMPKRYRDRFASPVCVL